MVMGTARSLMFRVGVNQSSVLNSLLIVIVQGFPSALHYRSPWDSHLCFLRVLVLIVRVPHIKSQLLYTMKWNTEFSYLDSKQNLICTSYCFQKIFYKSTKM